jgi:hypothetical protein
MGCTCSAKDKLIQNFDKETAWEAATMKYLGVVDFGTSGVESSASFTREFLCFSPSSRFEVVIEIAS